MSTEYAKYAKFTKVDDGCKDYQGCKHGGIKIESKNVTFIICRAAPDKSLPSSVSAYASASPNMPPPHPPAPLPDACKNVRCPPGTTCGVIDPSRGGGLECRPDNLEPGFF